ncbi:MAG TPA: RNA pseudouridine synthase [Desulfurivibrionaceae bacterium]|nr:RNA pseudouridine synthase [Desulfurivibrionaceae bacterium]
MKDKKGVLDLTLPVTIGGRAVDLLSSASNLSKLRLKEAMGKGAVWLRPARGKSQRLRRATAEVRAGDTLRLCYDEKILAAPVPSPVLLEDHRAFSIWFKPAGLLSQGTDFGDFCSLLRQVELHFQQHRKVFPVHRLDREVSGLVLVAHEPKSAARLSRCFAERLVAKSYLAGVKGRIDRGEKLLLNANLDGKPALSRVLGLAHDRERNESLVLVKPETGRLHQIRRHLADHGTPILGDYRYGGADQASMRLCAVRLVLPPDGKTPGLDLRLAAQYLPDWARVAGSVITYEGEI